MLLPLFEVIHWVSQALYNFKYGAWGEVVGGNTSADWTPIGFTGRWGGYWDARIDTVLNWNRWYGARSGRWVSRDPIGLKGDINFYAYTGNQSNTLIDPSGLKGMSYDDLLGLLYQFNTSGESNELLLCVAWHESGFDPTLGHKTARGLLQVTKSTSKYAHVPYDSLYDAKSNIVAWSRSFKGHKKTRGSTHDALEKGIAGGKYPGFAAKVETCADCLKKNGIRCSKCFEHAVQGARKGDRPQIPCDSCP